VEKNKQAITLADAQRLQLQQRTVWIMHNMVVMYNIGLYVWHDDHHRLPDGNVACNAVPSLLTLSISLMTPHSMSTITERACDSI
jgi:hypothetical protein